MRDDLVGQHLGFHHYIWLLDSNLEDITHQDAIIFYLRFRVLFSRPAMHPSFVVSRVFFIRTTSHFHFFLGSYAFGKAALALNPYRCLKKGVFLQPAVQMRVHQVVPANYSREFCDFPCPRGFVQNTFALSHFFVSLTVSCYRE